ncbi:hypothetical protein H0H10_24385 [Streptomyces sp. TRM S81-3]|uniref:Uncharacterized protein n=1 Tax=Streptomyces griseicoloratus TaxID=2752516 RepID=A0A926QSD0_9ACTN|nr:hypothetical protein [Streptomyces griseicoloratus]MBD0422258.1 hypothetical protein [Streptomyces griseicoloratus]
MTDKQHEGDLERVSQQNSFTDFTRNIEEKPGGGLFNNLVRSAVEATPFGKAMHGRTNFEDYRLNDMIDLVEQTNPEDLESSGKALWDARDAITDAAKELDGHIERVHWVGKSGEAFRKWGRSLVASTYELSTFAGGAGDQITAAAMGLAAVRKAMPPRDTRPEEKALLPREIPTPKQVDGNEEYATAVRVEKDRQEAINQMNRLSSYYAVAQERLVELKTPEFTTMPDVGVPKPVPSSGDRFFASGGAGSAAPQTSNSTISAEHRSVAATSGPVAPQGSSDAPLRPTDATRVTVEPDDMVGTTIDSVGTLPPPSAPTSTGNTAPTVGAPGGSSGTPNAFGSGYGAPIANPISSKGMGGSGGVRGPINAQGRASTAGVSGAGPGRTGGSGPISQMGRATPSAEPVAKGVSPGAKSFPMGPGVTGGTARPGAAPAPRPHGGAATGAGHANGVVGGRPVTGAATPAKSGPRIPRGTVVGAEAAAGARPVDRRPGQHGVFGGPTPAVRSGSSINAPRSGPAASGAVTGNPAARNSAASAERNGMTRGGAGLVRGPGGRGKTNEDRDRTRASRPEPQAEEDETHLPTDQRRGVPPVVN